ncbi:MAG: NAD(P)-dependent alcohol dehydrogenase [Oceanicoccus sp.]
MRALTYEIPTDKSAVPTLRQVDLPVPQVGKGSVLVRVSYAGLSNFEREISLGNRNGALAKLLKKGAVVSGIEMAGIVESNGDLFKCGDRVVGYTNIFRGPFFHADYVAIPENKLAHIPESMSLQGAASLVGGALTSITALERIANVKPGQQIMVTGATGSVGITAVQLAVYLGAQVCGVCHSSQVDFLLRQGAATACAYDKDELPQPTNQFDVVFDTAPSLSFSVCTNYLKQQGTYITTMPHLDISGFIGSFFSRKKWGYLMEADTDVRRMSRLLGLMDAGAFGEVIDCIYPLTEADDAFQRQLQPGKQGKILINFNE